MTDILYQWLDSLGLSRPLFPFNDGFANGFLYAEVLHRYRLEENIKYYHDNDRVDTMLKNFIKLRKTLHLLGLDISPREAYTISQRGQGAAENLLADIYSALKNKGLDNTFVLEASGVNDDECP